MLLRPTICMPTYNNPATIVSVIEECLRCSTLSIVIVDDGSDIAVASLMPALDSRVTILRSEKNVGKGKSLQRAFAWALDHHFTHVVALDGDGQHLPTEIEKLVREMLAHPFALIVGNRQMGVAETPGVSRFGRAFSNFWVHFQTGVKIADSQSGMRVYPLFHLQCLDFKTSRFDFEIEILVRLLWQAVELREVSVAVHYPDDRVSHFDKFWDNVRISLLNIKLIVLMPLTGRRKKTKKAWSGKIRGGHFGNWILKQIVRFIGLRAAYFCLFFLCPYFYLFAPKARRAADQYWRVLEPQRGFLVRQLRVLQQFFALGQNLLDRLYLTPSTRDGFSTFANGMENIRSAAFAGKGLILVGAHVGGWSSSVSFIKKDRLPGELYIFEFEPEGLSVNKVTKSPRPETEKRFERVFVNKTDLPILKLKELLSDGKVVAVMGDRPVGSHYELVPLLGKLALIDTTSFLIAAACSTPVIFTFGFREKMKSYSFFATAPHMADMSQTKEHRTYSMAKEYAHTLETYIRQYPEQWFNFYPFWSTPPTIPTRTGVR